MRCYTVVMPPGKVFTGVGGLVRHGRVGFYLVVFGHIWEIAAHRKDMTADELDRATEGQMEENKQIAS